MESIAESPAAERLVDYAWPHEGMSIPSPSGSPRQQFETDTVSASSDVPRPLSAATTNHRLPHHQQLVRSNTTDVVSHRQPVTSTSPSSATTPRSSLNQIKRKPLSSAASPFAARFSQGSASTAPSHIDLPKPDHRFSRSGSIDSPTFYEYPSSAKVSPLLGQ